jgi:site-specific DNA-methyltransferase (adenine-specific)
MKASRSARNKTLQLSAEERERYHAELLRLDGTPKPEQLRDRIICADSIAILEQLPRNWVDLLILDPPYNLDKDFAGMRVAQRDEESYLSYLESWFPRLLPLLKPQATVYLCGDWRCAAADSRIMSRYLTLRNRITWQREKGRGAKTNWKNACEDIWFATCSDVYVFNLDAVKMRRQVIAPYRANGQPKDWQEQDGGRFRLTHPGNFWDDLTVPYWSMPENTDHPTQKPEKLMAKLILASSNPGDMVFDPFLGSGSSAVVARKLGRHFCGIDCNAEYCCWALKRLEQARIDKRIQGYQDGVFWERNTSQQQLQAAKAANSKNLKK